jgi:hypothetical protein
MWVLDQPVKIGGLAVTDGRVRSRPDRHRVAFWVDREGVPSFGQPPHPQSAREGAAGFKMVLRDGKILETEDGVRHPRTAVGLDEDSNILHMVVVDGRQDGLSEGVSTHELAAHMRELGCDHALNLDGGGSSIMVLGQTDGTHRVVNSPSDNVLGFPIPRPIPVAICIVPAAPSH